jgi:hypothetical protein
MPAAPTATKAPAETPGTAREPESVVSFRRASGEGRYTFEIQSNLTLGSTPQDLGPIDIKAYDYMRSLLLLVETTTPGAGTNVTYAADGPFNAFTYVRVKQPNGQTMYSVTSGYHAAMIHKYGFTRRYSDPRGAYIFNATGGSSPSFQFAIRIPFELDLRDALGALPNKDAAAPFTLELGLNSLANVFSTAPTSSPVFKVVPILEAYDQPPMTLDGKPVQTTPPNMNTLQRWTEQTVTMVSGAFDARVKKLGNYLRELIFISKNSSLARVSDVNGGWSDPVQIVLDEDVKDNIAAALWKQDIYECWGYGRTPNGGTASTALDSPGGQDTGVWPYQYCVDRRSIAEDVAAYLPTIESEDYLLRGNWGPAVYKMTVLVGEVLPRGDIFGDV